MVERTCDKENKAILFSNCCKEPYEEILVDGGEVEIRCEKCGKVCTTLKEKYSIRNFEIFVVT